MRGQPISDLVVEAFLALRRAFFEPSGEPRAFPLREKRNTQDDPLDEHVHGVLSKDLPRDTQCLRAPGPLITPDLVLLRPEICREAPRWGAGPNAAAVSLSRSPPPSRLGSGGLLHPVRTARAA